MGVTITTDDVVAWLEQNEPLLFRLAIAEIKAAKYEAAATEPELEWPADEPVHEPAHR